MKATLTVLASTLALAGCPASSPLCVDSVQCATNAQWDPAQCMCVVNTDAGGCVQNVLCTTQAHWDPVRCACVVDNADGGCVQNVLCVQNAHWDPAACKCVPNAVTPDLAENCNSNCNGGTTGCPSMCTGCGPGQLCCAWAGGVCIPTDGGCMGAGGFSCANPTPAGLCPNQCYP